MAYHLARVEPEPPPVPPEEQAIRDVMARLGCSREFAEAWVRGG